MTVCAYSRTIIHMPRVVIFDVDGMTCRSCERLIGDALRAIPGVLEVEVSLKQRRAAIRLADGSPDPDLNAANAALKQHGCRLFPEGTRAASCSVAPREPFWRRIGRAFVVLGAVGAILLILSPLRQSVPSVSAGASVAVMFGLGIVASLSSCLASTGGFLLAVGSRNPSRSKTLAIHAGRLAAFAVGGAALGAIGSGLPSVSFAWYGILALVLGAGFLLVGLNLMDLAPSLARFGIALPSGLHRAGDHIAESKHGFAPFLVGAVTFVLPCGFTQTAQALALASGSPLRGLLLLVAFSAGTLPVLLGLSWFGSSATLRHRTVRLVAGAVLVLFAFSQIDGGLTVLGSPITVSSAMDALRPPPATAAPAPDGNEQVIRMIVAGSFQPNRFTVRSGVPVRWEIDGEDVSGCVNSIVMPLYGISQRLVLGPNVIRFTPKTPGSVSFSCGMGMVRGTITVI